jgi:hypothetical protein
MPTSKQKPQNPPKPKKSKKVNGREKGAGFERQVAKLLSAWWGVEFHRTPQSGGLHWQKDNRVAGDIVAPVEIAVIFPFSIECKKHEDWNFEQVIKGTGEIPSWWNQCVNDANNTGKIPLLIFTKNFSPIYYMALSVIHQKLFNGIIKSLRTTIEFEVKCWDVTIGFFDDLRAIPKEELLKLLDHREQTFLK